MTNYPRLSFINSITNAQQAVLTFTADHDFTVGEIVSVRCGKKFGMQEINNKQLNVVGLTSDTITVDLDTINFTPFTYALINTEGTSPPCCVPSSSGVVPNTPLNMTNIQDAFDNRPV